MLKELCLAPPFATGVVAGCTPDLIINILLSFLFWVPGQIHGLYLVYTYYKKHEEARIGVAFTASKGIWSHHVQTGGRGALPPAVVQ
jgi:uncharacterized membrane protein YqaE (UPF0057 family)